TNGGKVNLSLPLADGTGYLWNAWCNDSSGRYAWLNSLANFTLKVDTLNVTQPTLGNVLLGSLYYGNDVLGADLTPTVNWTAVTEANFKNYIIQFSDWSNFSHINVTAYTTLAVANNSVTMGTLVDNINYSWRVIAYEDSGEANTSQVYHYKTDSVNSSVNLGIPANNAWSTTAEVNFTWTVTDNNLGGCMLYANFSGTFAANSSLIVGAANATNFSIPNGEYIWNVWCNDTAFPANSAYNSSNRTLKIDTNVPVIVSGINANATVSRIVTFNVTQASGTSVVNQSSIRIGRVTGALNSNFNYTNDCTAITNGYSCSYIETGMLAGATNYLPIDANNTARGAATQYNLSLTMTMAQNLTTRLAAGWNLLSVPFVLSDTSIGDMVANDSKILKMYYYNGTGWRIWNSDGADSLTTLEPRKGYWVNTSAATDLFLYGEYTTGTPAQPYGGLSLPVGWHTIGAYDAGGADGVDTDDALASVCGSSNGGLCSAGDRNWDSLYYYNNATDLLVNVLNTDMTGDNLWNKGSAFWIYMNTADTYI
ncbi:hypothetical protein HQ529_05020, partial [Candidatus Woesearchaeota archaeon]|nr:hypothetical protein [Candidatus Woesearchaeota archaeon]